jgi:hypothetical protein
MIPLSHKGLGAIDAPAPTTPDAATPHADAAMEFARHLPQASADAALAILAFTANQAVAGQVTFAHFLGELAHAHAYDLSTAGAGALPEGALRDAVASLAHWQARVAAGVIDAANQYGRRCAHLAFAFPRPSPARF